MNQTDAPSSEIILYQTEDGRTRIQVRIEILDASKKSQDATTLTTLTMELGKVA